MNELLRQHHHDGDFPLLYPRSGYELRSRSPGRSPRPNKMSPRAHCDECGEQSVKRLRANDERAWVARSSICVSSMRWKNAANFV
jgi:hypothetical protein